MSELNKSETEQEYHEHLFEKHEVLRSGNIKNVEMESGKYKCNKGVYQSGTRHVGGQGKSGSEWWSEKVGVAVAKTIRAFEE